MHITLFFGLLGLIGESRSSPTKYLTIPISGSDPGLGQIDPTRISCAMDTFPEPPIRSLNISGSGPGQIDPTRISCAMDTFPEPPIRSLNPSYSTWHQQQQIKAFARCALQSIEGIVRFFTEGRVLEENPTAQDQSIEHMINDLGTLADSFEIAKPPYNSHNLDLTQRLKAQNRAITGFIPVMKTIIERLSMPELGELVEHDLRDQLVAIQDQLKPIANAIKVRELILAEVLCLDSGKQLAFFKSLYPDDKNGVSQRLVPLLLEGAAKNTADALMNTLYACPVQRLSDALKGCKQDQLLFTPQTEATIDRILHTASALLPAHEDTRRRIRSYSSGPDLRIIPPTPRITTLDLMRCLLCRVLPRLPSGTSCATIMQSITRRIASWFGYVPPTPYVDYLTGQFIPSTQTPLCQE